ncbi:MAG: hypothetical protein ACXWTE_01295 [Methylobacter sp.]
MKQQPYIITTFGLMIALTGLSPIMAADAGRISGGGQIQPEQRQLESPQEYTLSPEQMDNIHAGMIATEDPAQHLPPVGFEGRGVTCGHISCAGL